MRNQESAIKSNFSKIFQYFSKLNAEVIVVESGSTDNSVRLIRALGKKYKFKFVQPGSSGKGLAIKAGVKAATGNVIGYLDTDLAVPLKYVPEALSKFSKGYDIVIGNRYLKTSKAKRKISRYIESKAYIYLIRLLYRSKITDFQCGFKFFRADFIKDNIGKVNDNRWFFDTHILLLAEKNNLRIFSIPVEFRDTDKSTVATGDIFYFFKQAIKNMPQNK